MHISEIIKNRKLQLGDRQTQRHLDFYKAASLHQKTLLNRCNLIEYK